MKAEVKTLLEQLKKEKDSTSIEARRIRRQLRKFGHSIRGKKEDAEPKKEKKVAALKKTEKKAVKKAAKSKATKKKVEEVEE